MLALLTSSLWGLVVAVPLLAALVWVEARVPEPVLSLPLLRQRPIWVSSTASALNGAAMFTSLTYVPLYMQAVLGASPTEAGAAIAPMVVGWPIASALSGRLLPRLGFRPFIRLGLAVSAASACALALLLEGDRRLVAQVAMFCFGVGMGFSNTALLIAVQTTVDWTQRGSVTAVTMFCRTIGGTLAVGTLGGFLAARLGTGADEINHLLAHRGGGGLRLPPAILAPLESGLHTTFWVFAAFALAAFVVGLWFPSLRSYAQRE